MARALSISCRSRSDAVTGKRALKDAVRGMGVPAMAAFLMLSGSAFQK